MSRPLYSHLTSVLVGSDSAPFPPVFDVEHPTTILETKLLNKNILLDNPERKRKKKDTWMASTRKAARVQHKTLSASLGLPTIKYETAQKMGELWNGYIADVVSASSDVAASLTKADYHGATVRVVKAAQQSQVHQSGILIQETLNTFILLTPSSKTIMIPKKGAVFAINVPSLGTVHLFGNQLMQHSGHRISKKIKPHNITE